MWSIQSLDCMNASYVNKKRAEPPPTSLDILIKRLAQAAPPSLSSLMDLLYYNKKIGMYGMFVDLINELMPEYKQEILCCRDSLSRITEFCRLFQRKYFELYDDWIFGVDPSETYDSLLHHIPVYLLGMSFQEYEGIPESEDTEIILLTCLLENPWDEDRVALIEAAAQIVPKETLMRIPYEGISITNLDLLVKNTKFQTLALYGKIIAHDTGNYFYDTDIDTYNNGEWPVWNKPTVVHLTKKWKQAMKWQKELLKFREWLKKDLINNFEELLNFLLERKEEISHYGHDPNRRNPNIGIELVQ